MSILANKITELLRDRRERGESFEIQPTIECTKEEMAEFEAEGRFTGITWGSTVMGVLLKEAN